MASHCCQWSEILGSVDGQPSLSVVKNPRGCPWPLGSVDNRGSKELLMVLHRCQWLGICDTIDNLSLSIIADLRGC